MPILVSDTNIFIDMDVGNLTRSMFRLEETFAAPDILYQEELEEYHGDLPSLGLRIEPLGSSGVAAAARLAGAYRGLSTHDVFAIALAMERQWPLLSGDRRLRAAASTEGVEVHGTIWLIRRLVETRTISLARARDAVALMRRGGRWLPWTEIEEMLQELEINI